jgi:phosphatidylglycerophosphatase C
VDVVLLDFDGTITRRDTTRALLLNLFLVRPWQLLVALSPLLRLAGGGTDKQVQLNKDQCVGALLRGLSESRARQCLQRYRIEVYPLIRPELAALIRERTASGQRVLVVTASAEIAVSEALQGFDVTVLGTQYVMSGGSFTGALASEGCYGEAKVTRVLSWARTQLAPPRFIEAWSDAVSDLPMLRLAENRVWVCSATESERFMQLEPKARVFDVG